MKMGYREAYAVVGIGFVLIFSALALVHKGLTKKGDTMSVMSGTLILASDAFKNGESIPANYTCDAAGAAPKLSISGAPESAKSFVLIVTDPDVPKQLKPDGIFLHWLMFDIPEGTSEVGTSGISGTNAAGRTGYVPPCPPSAYEPSEHRYIFHLYALDTLLGLPPGASESEVRGAMNGHVVDEAELVGKYKRK